MENYRFLLAPVLAWLVAQGLKYLLTLRKDGAQLYDLVASGGMPSSHTATIVALSTAIFQETGGASPLFALSALVSFIVMYDAIGVRRTTGEQTQIIKKLSAKAGVSARPLHGARGHQPLEVAAGAVLGVAIGILLSVLA